MAIDNLYEKELLQRIAQSDEDAFKEVFEIYKERFYAAALKMMRSSFEAEDIVQEVFVTLWLHRAPLSEVDNPTSYLFTIVYNTIAARFRKMAAEAKMKQTVAAKTAIVDYSSEEKLEEKETRQRLYALLKQLPPQQRLIYHLSREEGLSRDEIAKRLHISPNTVKNHLLKSLNYIRKHWNKMLSFIWLL